MFNMVYNLVASNNAVLPARGADVSKLNGPLSGRTWALLITTPCG